MRSVNPGAPYPLGATPNDTGVNFAIFSDNAEGVTLCLFDAKGEKELERIPLRECTNGIWHCHLPGVGRGQVYGWRVSGPWAPEHGHRFNDNKLLLDPYARELVGNLTWDDALYGYTIGAGDDADLVKDERDSAPFLPKARIHAPMPLVATQHPRTSWPKTVIYEAHVRGLTMRVPGLPDDMRGTFAAISTPAMLDHLTRIGITAIEFMPVHAFAQDRHLVERGLANYWGYNTLSFFAPEPRYLDGAGLEDIAVAVDRLHQAGIEVILDVVYNHTCEGNHLGPTLSWRGIDNAAYYRLMPGESRYFDNLTGCGNALNTEHPRVLQMVLDSLRMWARVYGIDGFRFDLATTLGRKADGFDPSHAFFNAILQDPVLGQTKLIAEPWDIGPGGYQLGAFPAGFSEWNGDYRDVIRDFWVGEDGKLGAFATRFAASSDLFGEGHKRPWSSVNFVTAHDGFTLDDLVSYNGKHNEANGEDNRDGHDDNRSWNCGAEGPTDDPAILALRQQQKRNLLATLFLSQGVPMLLGGDEIGNSQSGNNNAYCQDNPISWIDWDRHDPELSDFVAKLIALRKSRSALSRPEFLSGARNARGQPDVIWYSADGKRMTPEAWNTPHFKCLTVFLSPVLPNEPGIIVMFNASHLDVSFLMPRQRAEAWSAIIDTAGKLQGSGVTAGSKLTIAARSLVVWESVS